MVCIQQEGYRFTDTEDKLVMTSEENGGGGRES